MAASVLTVQHCRREGGWSRTQRGRDHCVDQHCVDQHRGVNTDQDARERGYEGRQTRDVLLDE